MPIDKLVEEARGMSDEAIMEAVRFLQFLKIAPIMGTTVSVSPINNGDRVYRRPGLYRDQIVMAEGFDDPLDDFEEYM